MGWTTEPVGAAPTPGVSGVPAASGVVPVAEVPVLPDAPPSTTRLTAVTGRGPRSAGRHPRVQLDAGLVDRRRAGRSVRRGRTAAGDALVEAGTRTVTRRS
ncbi:hypothetical protein [Streptomyces sp. NPDC086777]|uniref:hypothetical protein n=1 Tax=Streptomyces sp. NPDC086777 TaxID=3154866 RepID=UPI00344F849F